MEFQTSLIDGISVTEVSGRMDAITAPLFSEECQQLFAGSAGRFIFDLAGLEYISSAGLRSILMVGKLAKTQKASIAFCSMQAMVADMFKISCFNT